MVRSAKTVPAWLPALPRAFGEVHVQLGGSPLAKVFLVSKWAEDWIYLHSTLLCWGKCPPLHKRIKVQLQMVIQHRVWQLPPTSWLHHCVSGCMHVCAFMTPPAWFISCDTAWFLQATVVHWESATKACSNHADRFSTWLWHWRSPSSVPVVNSKQSH